MKKLNIFISTALILITCSKLFPDGYIQIHNKTKYPAKITYNFGTQDKYIEVNGYRNSQILSTRRGFFRSHAGNIKKLDIQLYFGKKQLISKSIENLDIKVNKNEITHIYIIHIHNSNKSPRLKVICIQKGKILGNPFLKENQNIISHYNTALKTIMKPQINKISKEQTNEKALFLIQNKSNIPLKITTPSISFYEDFANIKCIYLQPGDYYYQTLDEVFEAKKFKIQEINGKRNKIIEKIKIPRGNLTIIEIMDFDTTSIKTVIKRTIQTG